MAKLQKFVEQTDWLWYTAELTNEQTVEYKAYLEALEKDEHTEEPEWLYELDYDLTRDKPGSEDTTFELIED